jgi:hypothetical protein
MHLEVTIRFKKLVFVQVNHAGQRWISVDLRIIGHFREQARNSAMQQQDPNDENQRFRQTARGATHRASAADVSARRLTQITH